MEQIVKRRMGFTVERPALIWKNATIQTPCQLSLEYWTVPTTRIEEESESDLPTNYQEYRTDLSGSGSIHAISYAWFYDLTIRLIVQLRIELQEVIAIHHASSDASPKPLLSIPVAVAIPEGPYLPLTVTAVHALNVPFRNTKSCHYQEISAVLLPLDPSDGQERLLHMLYEARPILILTAANYDQERLQHVVKKHMTTLDTKLQDNNDEKYDMLYNADRIQVLNVQQLLKKGRRRHQNTYLSSSNTTHLLDATTSLQEQLNEYGKCTIGEAIFSGKFMTDNRISHIVYTSGSTGRPKGCLSSSHSLQHYLHAKNISHHVTSESTILLASAVTFDPCISDILATLTSGATLALAPRHELLQHLQQTIQVLQVSHVLCTPTLWSTLHARPCDFVHLKVVALGGEQIPFLMQQSWARPSNQIGEHNENVSCGLYATFGVTEACVYQTLGEVVANKRTVGQDVGFPFTGMQVRICEENRHDRLIDVVAGGYPNGVGEIVLSGNQLDCFSAYFRRAEQTTVKFVQCNKTLYFRTGDQGYIDPATNRIHILGRITGQEGMVKFNGVRVELSEIEIGLIDEHGDQRVVVDAVIHPVLQQSSNSANKLLAYIVLHPECLVQLGLSASVPASGLICTGGPLLSLLQYRCKTKVGVLPSTFIAIPYVPLSPTGKRSRQLLPSEESIKLMDVFNDFSASGTSLFEYGRNGPFVAKAIVDCLNLQDNQKQLLSTKATFGMLGGDSLSATRVVRLLYASHHGIRDSRLIGGEFGILQGSFAVVHLLSSKNLQSYVDFLDKHGVCESLPSGTNIESMRTGNTHKDLVTQASDVQMKRVDTEKEHLYDALLQAVTTDAINVASALLDVGADPNHGDHGGRLGKTPDRRHRKVVFRSSPLHLACLHGLPRMVEKLLAKGAKATPDAAGLYPIHLAAAGQFNQTYTEEHDQKRLECVRFLLRFGNPLTMKDGSKQTVLHAAARAGHYMTLRFVLKKWVTDVCSMPNSSKQRSLDWRDCWSRTPVHWAVLNGKVKALEVLLEYGCSANPFKPLQSFTRTSAAIESPLEMNQRLHHNSPIGNQILELLKKYHIKTKTDETY